MAQSVPALEAAVAEDVALELREATIGGTLLLPPGEGPVACVVIVGGTLSSLRDGELARPGVPRRGALRRLAESLAESGYGSFRYDQVGHGASRAKAGWGDLYRSDAQVLAGILAYLRGREECGALIVAGESAGAYVACLAARDGVHADGYVFLGGFCGKAEEIFDYNHGRLAEYVDRSAENAAWAREWGLERYLAYGRKWREMFAAARERREEWDLEDGDFRERVRLGRRTEELDHPPEEMFRYIARPALAVAGSRDRNVPPSHAACAVAAMQRAGNLRTESRVIEGADHSFQVAPEEEDAAIRERFTFASFANPYDPLLDRVVVEWLDRNVAGGGRRRRALSAAEWEAATATTPERLHLAPGVTVISDILDTGKTPGVETLEGRIGPLLRVPGMRAHFIDMPAGLYLAEHSHAKGSLIYTVRGRWGLQSMGRWQLMRPGSLYWFGDGVPTGFQVPFLTDAYILIFKAVEGDGDESFVRYLRGMAAQLEAERAAGVAFRLTELAGDHEALVFARAVNPRFVEEFAPGSEGRPEGRREEKVD